MSQQPEKVESLAVGDKVKFTEEKQRYTVQAASERYAVCTKPFNLRKTVFYTIVDFKDRIRGTENLIFGAGAETKEQCEEMIARLEGRDPEMDFVTEISRRNYVGLHIESVDKALIATKEPQ